MKIVRLTAPVFRTPKGAMLEQYAPMLQWPEEQNKGRLIGWE